MFVQTYSIANKKQTLLSILIKNNLQLSINIRISELIELLESGNRRSFCKKIGIATTTLQGIVGQRQSDPGSKILNRVLEAYPNINARWLICGKGQKFESDIDIPAMNIASESNVNYSEKENCIMCREKDKRIAELENHNKELISDKEWLKLQLACKEESSSKRVSA